MTVSQTVHAEVRSQDPSAPAVAAADASLTYGELVAQADAAAAVLAGLGVVAGDVVAVCLPRSAALVVAQLAVLSLDAAYLALDPAHPAARLAAVVEDSGAPVLITAAGAQLTGSTRRPSEPGLAYVIYTSGSTGTPKGVMVEHTGLLNLTAWHRDAFGVGPGTRCSQVGGPGFDASVWETWGALANGGVLHIPAEELKTDPAGLRDWLVAEAVEVAFLPTPLAEAVVAVPWPAGAPLRFLLTGGDRLHAAPPAGLPFALVNNYGLTEASVVTTSAVVPAGGEGAPSIGRVISGVSARVVDTGELLVSGVSLARGYLGNPALTAARFVEHGGVRWYHTGDVVTERADGLIDYRGRLDEQVQVRGFRVEPAEVGAVLDRHAGVAEAVVVADGERLVAFVRPVGALDESALRAHVEALLPAPMLPSTYVAVDAMPVTPNGKVDRDALLALVAPDGEGAETSDDEVTAAVAEIVAGLLGIPHVGDDENFLLLGGHSLMGAQLVIRLEETFGVEVGLRAVFDNPTPAGMAAEVHRLLIEEITALSDEDAAELAALED